jgi:hypothetical protein
MNFLAVKEQVAKASAKAALAAKNFKVSTIVRLASSF